MSPAAASVVRGGRGEVDVTARAGVPTLWSLIFTDRTVRAATAAGDLDLTGSAAAAQRFFRLFGPPA